MLGVKGKMEGLSSPSSPVFLDALQAEYTPFATLFPFPSLSVKSEVKTFGTANMMDPRRLLPEQGFCLEQALTLDDL